VNPLNETDEARQQARTWSGRLGTLAAELPAIRLGAPFNQLDATPLAALPTRLTSILNHLRQRAQRRQEAADKLRAQEFIMAP
jgi:hypothetical protein